jgi:hypothetical protein
VFLIHDYTEEEKALGKTKGNPARIFGYFTIDSILLVDAKQLMESLKIKPELVQNVSAEEASEFLDRGCGQLKLGGIYLVSNSDMKELQKHADGAQGNIKLIKPWIEIEEVKRWRGYKYIDGQQILANQDLQAGFKMAEKIRNEKPEKPQTLLSVMTEVVTKQEPIKRTKAIAEARKIREPESKRPDWVYNDIIRRLIRKDVITRVKNDNKEEILTLTPKKPATETPAPTEAETEVATPTVEEPVTPEPPEEAKVEEAPAEEAPTEDAEAEETIDDLTIEEEEDPTEEDEEAAEDDEEDDEDW